MGIPLYFDEDSMDHRLLRALRSRGVDVVIAFEVNMIRKSDREHLNYATAQGRVLCSSNVGDFMRLHTEYLNSNKQHAGIILIPQQSYSIGETMRRLLRLAATKSSEDMQDWVEFLSAWGQ
ncbi:MAG: DUF5615 family PIN-like protein [Chloroflexi bacterium]|nr:DUF5615 family PIN-like protein [Chloroflexota bacterium]MCI0577672.1 DUF5615 family PIN-like protein [Chloroflexota bacterium]MCI0648054.1 DUF5615 family PIN-like protein [Chloroflexota bacterium]MCI0732161.1 DUF5615 family PIN-like protein [Chloroflexota bacterium]